MTTLQLPPETAAWLAETYADDPLGAASALGSLPALHESLLADAAAKLQLDAAEAQAILDACNGLHLTPVMAGQHLELEVYDSIRLNRLDEKWGTEPDFMDRIHLLSRGERWAVEVWAASFWSGGDPERYPGGRYNDAAWCEGHLAKLVRRQPRAEDPDRGPGQPARAGEPTVVLSQRYTPGERDRLRELAERAGISVSEYVRRMVL